MAAPATTWMPDYYQPKYNEGFNAGYSAGYDTGLATGKQRGTTEGTSTGHGDGYSAGYGESYQPAYDHAYDIQYPIGNQQGWATGVHDGLIAGYNWADYVSHLTMSSSSGSVTTFNTGVFSGGLILTSGGNGRGTKNYGTIDGADYTVWRAHLTDYSNTAYWSSHFYDLGYSDGTSPGTTAGDTDGYNLAYPVAYTAAYKTGHAEGLVVGFNDGTSQGGTDGFQTGWSDGNNLGSDQGFAAGYDFYFSGKHGKLQYVLNYTRRSSESASVSVPEPARILQFSLGAVGLIALRRRRSRNSSSR